MVIQADSTAARCNCKLLFFMCCPNILFPEAGCGASLADFCSHVNILVAPTTKAESCADRAWPAALHYH